MLFARCSEIMPRLTYFSTQGRQMEIAERGLDLENRAYYITVSLQWWLMIRLELFASILILGIALFAAGFRNSVKPSKIGVVLTYALSGKSLFLLLTATVLIFILVTQLFCKQLCSVEYNINLEYFNQLKSYKPLQHKK